MAGIGIPGRRKISSACGQYCRVHHRRQYARRWIHGCGLIAVVDGLKGFPDAIRAVFPEATVQTCIVRLMRHSLDFVSYKDRKVVAAALEDIYRATDAIAGLATLDAFADGPLRSNCRQSRAAAAWGQNFGREAFSGLN